MYFEFRSLVHEVARGVKVLSKSLAKTVISHPAIGESIGQAMIVVPGLMYPQLAYSQLVEYGLQPVNVVLIGMCGNHRVNDVGSVVRLYMVGQLVPRVLKTAVDYDNVLLLPGATQIAPTNGDGITTLGFLTYADEIYLVAHDMSY